MTKFNVGDRVRVIASPTASLNKTGDVGEITEYDSEKDVYRVNVLGRSYKGNWQTAKQIELVERRGKGPTGVYAVAWRDSEGETHFVRGGHRSHARSIRTFDKLETAQRSATAFNRGTNVHHFVAEFTGWKEIKEEGAE